jgi:hypothetical protein
MRYLQMGTKQHACHKPLMSLTGVHTIYLELNVLVPYYAAASQQRCSKDSIYAVNSLRNYSLSRTDSYSNLRSMYFDSSLVSAGPAAATPAPADADTNADVGTVNSAGAACASGVRGSALIAASAEARDAVGGGVAVREGPMLATAAGREERGVDGEVSGGVRRPGRAARSARAAASTTPAAGVRSAGRAMPLVLRGGGTLAWGTADGGSGDLPAVPAVLFVLREGGMLTCLPPMPPARTSSSSFFLTPRPLRPSLLLAPNMRPISPSSPRLPCPCCACCASRFVGLHMHRRAHEQGSLDSTARACILQCRAPTADSACPAPLLHVCPSSHAYVHPLTLPLSCCWLPRWHPMLRLAAAAAAAGAPQRCSTGRDPFWQWNPARRASAAAAPRPARPLNCRWWSWWWCG